MNLTLSREELLKPLQSVIGVVERRQTLPILANVRLALRENTLYLTTTDLEVEMQASLVLATEQPDATVTVAARKLLDICRSLPAEANLQLTLEGGRMLVRGGRSRFMLATLPAEEFPLLDSSGSKTQVRLAQSQLRYLLEQTQIAMAQQDVRYYLNGLLLELRRDHLRAVGTDGHRLATSEVPAVLSGETERQIIVPRKGIVELFRLLRDSDAEAILELADNYLRVDLGNEQFTSKLIDGRFPDYERVIPARTIASLQVARASLREALGRAAILSNEKYRGVRLSLTPERVSISANNSEHESAEEELEASYDGEAMEIGFNVGYLTDPLTVLAGSEVELRFTDANGSCLLLDPADLASRHVVMPMRL